MRDGEWRGILAAMLSSTLGGTAVVVTRLIIGDTDPITLALLRYGIGVALLWLILAARRHAMVERRDLAAVIVLGILLFAIFPSLFNLALAWTTAARGALALSTLPLLTLLLAAGMRAEPVTAQKLAGVTLAVVGVGLALAGDLASAPAGAWRGDLVMVATAACGAAYNVLSRPYVRRYPALPFTAQPMLAGATALLLLTLLRGGLGSIAALPGWAWLGIAWLGVMGAAAAFWLWSVGLEYTTPTRVAVTVTVNPIVAMSLGGWLLAEPVTPSLVGGMLAVAAGIGLVSLPDHFGGGLARDRQADR
ncbi:MAG TPA: DMT family transporter [Geminicoccaceae bacterium]|nr:DMT family transporter [Geminicoccus sp.]HMU50414.1 DMT family transporter [Geminicoccaceae bacterium]